MADQIKLVLGTMTFGPQVNATDSRAMAQRFLEAGHHELDTAYVYNGGETETILGALLTSIPDDSFRLATKVHPRVTGKLDGSAVTTQLEESLRRLARDSVDILYFHFPDPNTPIEGALEACAKLHGEGKFKELGLSNYPAWKVVDIWHICRENGWPRPSVYQGLYNGVSRKAETELFPALRELGMRFYAFNPLAGGLLTGKHKSYDDTPPPGRFDLRASYRTRYWRKPLFDAVNVLTASCREATISPVGAAFRWLAHHSCLDSSEGDAIILGASSMDQLEQNLAAVREGPLPQPILDAFNAAWEAAMADSPIYFRNYSP